MLKLPVYLRNSVYYLHTRINGKQVKRSLNTSDRLTAIIRATQLLQYAYMDNSKIRADLFNIDPEKVRRFEIDLSRGILKADGPEDHARMMEALAVLKNAPMAQSAPLPAVHAPEPLPKAKAKSGLKLLQLVDKFFNLKSQLKPATVVSYTNSARELSDFLDNSFLTDIRISDITRYQESLTKKNSARTIDNKMATLRTLFNFAIKQGYYFGDNPAQDRIILTKKDKVKLQWEIFTEEELKLVMHSDFLKKAKEEDKHYYYSLMLEFYTGCRINEITSLTKKQFLKTKSGVNYISVLDSKTVAGVRKIPLPQVLFDEGLQEFVSSSKERVFKYPIRLGKGSGNAVGKKFKRNLEAVKIERDKLVFHSIRKFLNDYLMKSGMQYEPRCQFIGHEIDDINVTIYTNEYTVDQLAEIMQPYMNKLHILSGLLKTEF